MQGLSKVNNKQQGFSLVEVMISLALGLAISSAVVQILISNSVSGELNRAMASTQESGRFIVSRMHYELLMVGLYNPLDPHLNDNVDIVEEESFVRNHPIPIPGDFSNRTMLGSEQGVDGASDTLVFSLQATKDCRGFSLGYAMDEAFFVVNEYFVDQGKLKCRGFDGRVLRGQKAAAGHNGHAAYTILDNVLSFQVTYAMADPLSNDGETLPIRYIDASRLSDAFNAKQQVVSLRLAIVVKGEGNINLDRKLTFKLLNEDLLTAPDQGLYKAFETTVTFRNMRNFIRGGV
jgi:type IV pilus assembly protein PilW